MIQYDPKADFYKLLRLRADASSERIKRAHREEIRTAHPDKITGDKDRAALLNHARDVLLNETSRKAYDAARLAYRARKKSPPSRKRSGPAHKPDSSTTGPNATQQRTHTRPSAPKQPASPVVPTIDMKKVVEEALKNVQSHIQRREYGWAFVWGILGVVAGISEAEAA